MDQTIADTHRTLVRSHEERLLLDKSARRMALRQLQHAIVDNEEKIFLALKEDLGRSSFEAYVAEIAFIKDEIERTQKCLNTWTKPRLIRTPILFQPGSSYVETCAKGVVLIIAPWNYPFQLSLVPLVSALAAGNCVIVKPSELAPRSEEVIAHIINNYLDQRCFRAITGDVKTAQALLDHPFDHIFYTGNTMVGQEVMTKAAKHLTPVTLELGGKSPSIVDQSADLELATKRIAWGKCLNAGQTCIAPDYVLIERPLINDFVALTKTHLQKMFGDDPRESKSLGRIINQRHFDRLISYLKDGTVVIGGKYDRSTRYIEPTIMIDVDEKSPLMTEEIFGPILPLMPVDNLTEAIEFINRRPHPLALYIFSNSKDGIKNILDHTLSGSVAINDCVSQVAIPDLPFGGIRHSGLGQYHGYYGFETFSHKRAIHRRANFLDNPIKYAPYSENKLKLARLML